MPSLGQNCHDMRDYKCLSHVITVIQVDSQCIAYYNDNATCNSIAYYNLPCYAMLWFSLLMTVDDSVTHKFSQYRRVLGKRRQKKATFPARSLCHIPQLGYLLRDLTEYCTLDTSTDVKTLVTDTEMTRGHVYCLHYRKGLRLTRVTHPGGVYKHGA